MGQLHLFFPLLLSFALFLPRTLFAATSPEEVSRELVKAFTAGMGKSGQKAPISERTFTGFKVRTVSFAFGARLYRIVFSEDGTVSISLLSEGDIAAQVLWTKKVADANADEIVNFIYARELGKPYDRFAKPKPAEEIKADAEREVTRGNRVRESDGSELRWNNLINSVLRGEVGGGGRGSQTEQGFSKAMAMAKSLDSCGIARSGMGAQQAAITDIAQAMAVAQAATLARGGEKVTDRTREYEKKGDYSFLKELEEYGGGTPDAFRLIQDSGADPTELFRQALQESDKTARDPFSLAASRNFKFLIRSSGKKKAAAYVSSVLKRIVVDVDAFTKMRKIVPKASVVYDRIADKYYVDPTLNSPSEARYLLSLATFYEFQITHPDVAPLISTVAKLDKEISELERSKITVVQERELATLRTQLANDSKKLFDFAQTIYRLQAYPR